MLRFVLHNLGGYLFRALFHRLIYSYFISHRFNIIIHHCHVLVSSNQKCRLPKDKCPHRGCADTKLLLAHVKACPAGPDFPCPSRCKGCNETRKLLAHYRRCKDLRTKQVGLGRRSLLQPDQGSCLVCSLVARYAKGALDRTSNGGTSSQGKSNIAASLLSSSLDGKFNVERGLVNLANQARPTPIERTTSMTLMPPPPPRYGSCPSTSTSSLSNESFACSMRSSLADDAAVMTYPSRASAEVYSWSSDPSSLGKSVDTSVSVSFPILRRSRERREPTDDELIVPGPNIAAATSATSRRQRAGSYDERKTRVKFAPAIIAVSKSCNFDDRDGEGRRVPRPRSKIGNTTRPRSASCSNSEGGNAATSSNSCEFDAIVEEGAVGCEEPMFSMDL